MRLSNLLGAASLGALMLALAPAAQAATFSTPEYTVNYDDSSVFGSIVSNGSGSDGVTQTLSFAWATPFTGPTGPDPVAIASGSGTAFHVPAFVVTAASGYVFEDLTITFKGSVFGPASAWAAWTDSGFWPTYSGPNGPAGTWTLTGNQLLGSPFTELGFAGGALMLNSAGGTIFVTEGPEVRFTVVAVPEPESVALALAGVGVALLAARRRHSA